MNDSPAPAHCLSRSITMVQEDLPYQHWSNVISDYSVHEIINIRREIVMCGMISLYESVLQDDCLSALEKEEKRRVTLL